MPIRITGIFQTNLNVPRTSGARLKTGLLLTDALQLLRTGCANAFQSGPIGQIFVGEKDSGRVFDFYPLEDRILLSGEGLDGAELAPDADFVASLMAEIAEAEGQPSADPALVAADDALAAGSIPAENDFADAPTFDLDHPLEVVFVDSGVDDADTLLDGLRESRDDQTQWLIVELSADTDGIQLITQTLSQLSSVDAVHIVSHGDGEGIQLGNARLDTETASGYAGEIATWGNSLDPGADLLLYGCDLASTSDGRTLIDSISALTGADVAASDDATGNQSLGGDWDLEYGLGEIETQVAFDLAVQQEWMGLLDGEVVSEPPAALETTADYLAVPLAFEENQGQTDDQVDFLARGSGYTVFLSEGDAVLKLGGADDAHVLRMDLLGADPSATVSGVDLLGSQSNYLLGNDPAAWQTDVENYRRVEYLDVYEGIDVQYYGNNRQLEYDFIVQAGASVDEIRLSFDGAHSLHIAATGELVITLNQDGDEVRFKAPYAYQDTAAGRQLVESNYVIHADGTLGFEVGDYDASQTLVIDPILDYSTFLGGLGTETAKDIAVDASGNVYVMGQTQSTDFPGLDIQTGLPKSTTDNDIYVTKLSADGSTVLFSTFIGGSSTEYGARMELGPSGEIYLSGSTSSSDLPTTAGAYQTALDGSADGFLMVLNAAGNSLQYSTLFGGNDGESGGGLAVDDAGVAYITGQTLSNDLPNIGSYDTGRTGASDVYVAKINPAGTGSSDLLYTTYLGGSTDYEASYGIALDSNGYIHVLGRTLSSDHPVTAGTAIQSTFGGTSDAYLTVLDPTAGTSGLVYSTYLGGSDSEAPSDIYIDSNDIVYITGSTRSTDLLTTSGAFSTSNAGIADAFVYVIDTSLSGVSGLVYGTYLGGTDSDSGAGIVADSSGLIHVTGSARAAFPMVDPIQGTFGGLGDAFVARLNPAGGGVSDLQFSTYLGGTGYDSGSAIALDSSGDYYIAGSAGDATHPTTTGAYDTTFNGGSYDAFVAKFLNAPMNTAPILDDTPILSLDPIAEDSGRTGRLRGHACQQSCGPHRRRRARQRHRRRFRWSDWHRGHASRHRHGDMVLLN